MADVKWICDGINFIENGIPVPQVPTRSWLKQECWAKRLQTIMYLMCLAPAAVADSCWKGCLPSSGVRHLKRVSHRVRDRERMVILK